MAGNLFILPVMLATDPVNGVPLSGGKLYFYENGTTTPKDTYQDSDLSTPHTNPVIADAGGYFPIIWLDGVYSWKLTDSDDVQIDSDDDLAGAVFSNVAATFSALVTFNEGYVNDPEHATDSGTDAFVSTTNTSTPGDGKSITRDFQSANTTTTPTLDGKTLTTRDSSALWAGAVSGVHELQYDSGADTYLVLEPIPQTDIGTDALAQLDKFTAGHIDGLKLSNGTDSDHDIDIATGVCSMRDGSGNRKLFELTSGLTKQIDANWAEGVDAGGFPSGLTLSADTHYNLFLIGKDDGSVDAGFDTSATASNLLSDASSYSWFRRIGSIFTDGSSNIRGFTQKGDTFFYNSVTQDVSDNAGTLGTYETASVPAPPNQIAIVSAWARADSAGQLFAFVAGAEGATGTASYQAIASLDPGSASGTLHVAGRAELLLDGSSQLRYTMTVGGGAGSWSLMQIGVIGWIDDRGRNA